MRVHDTRTTGFPQSGACSLRLKARTKPVRSSPGRDFAAQQIKVLAFHLREGASIPQALCARSPLHHRDVTAKGVPRPRQRPWCSVAGCKGAVTAARPRAPLCSALGRASLGLRSRGRACAGGPRQSTGNRCLALEATRPKGGV